MKTETPNLPFMRERLQEMALTVAQGNVDAPHNALYHALTSAVELTFVIEQANAPQRHTLGYMVSQRRGDR